MEGTLPRLAAALTLAFAASFAAADDAADLARAKQLLATTGEGTVRQGAELCLKVGTADAMQIVMDVLDSEKQHYRDIAWEVIPRFTDAYARQVVASKLKSGGKQARLREWCAMALGAYGAADFAGPLKSSLTSPDEGLRAAAAHALGRIKDKSVLAALRERLHDKDPFARAAAIEAVARIAPAESKAAMWEGLRDPDAGVRCALLAALPEIYPDLAEETAVQAFRDEDWRPRMQGAEILFARRTKTAVDALVSNTDDVRPAVARRIVGHLQGVTGMKFTERRQWEQWWRENREKFAFAENPAGTPPADDKSRTFASFNGLEVTSDHVMFVIDKSADMLRALKNGKVRDAAAQAELETTLNALPAGVTFNVLTYGVKTQTAWKQPVALDAKSRAAALKFVAGVQCAGNKNIWEVVESVVTDGTIDTAYLLSSGEPEIGLYVHWNRVTEHMKILNRHYKVVFHGVSYSNSKWFQEQIQKIAESTGGKFVVRE